MLQAQLCGESQRCHGIEAHQAPRCASTRASSGARFTISLCTVTEELQALRPPSFACARHSSPAARGQSWLSTQIFTEIAGHFSAASCGSWA